MARQAPLQIADANRSLSGSNLIDPAELRSIACHEVGDTVGLMHPNIEFHGWSWNDLRFACMRQSSVSDAFLRDHNVGHIDGFYAPA